MRLIINPEGGIVKAFFSPGNKDDRKHLSSMIKDIFGKLVGDRGYISKALFADLFSINIHLITRIKKGMKNILTPIADKLLLLKRILVESVISRIKLLDKFEHSRHRSQLNAFSHMIASLISYQLLDHKPSIASLIPLENSPL